jgi:hypothetical protein
MRITDVSRRGAWIGVAVVAAATWAALAWEGRRGWCVCRTPHAFVADAYSSHTSQHLLDPYSFSHFQHGLVFCLALAWLAPRWSSGVRLVIAAIIEAAWEIAENSHWVIDRYREATAALGYEGDSQVNSLGDLAACVAGFVVAERIGWQAALAVFAAIELVMILAIRDSLLLNVLMLTFPVDAVRQWQLGAA